MYIYLRRYWLTQGHLKRTYCDEPVDRNKLRRNGVNKYFQEWSFPMKARPLTVSTYSEGNLITREFFITRFSASRKTMCIESVSKDDIKKDIDVDGFICKGLVCPVLWRKEKLHKLSLLLLKPNYRGGLLPVGIRKGGRVWTSALFIVFGFPFIGNQSQACWETNKLCQSGFSYGRISRSFLVLLLNLFALRWNHKKLIATDAAAVLSVCCLHSWIPSFEET